MEKVISTLVGTVKTGKRTKIILSSIFVLLIATVILFVGRQKNNGGVRDVYTITEKPIVKTVLASGKVVSETDLNLSFQDTNIVKSITVHVGDKVKKGQILATLSNAEKQADLTRARGQLLGAQARYNKVLEGSSSVDVLAAVDAYENIQKTQNRLVENALRTLLSSDLVAEPTRTDMDPALAPQITGTYLGDKETQYTLSFKQSNRDLQYSGPENGQVVVYALPQNLGNKGLVVTFPTLSYALNDEWTISIPNKKGKNYTTYLNAYNAALATRDELVNAAKSRVDVLKTAARQVDIDAARADVLVADAGVRSAEAALEKTILRAPLDGTITKIDIKLGDFVPANQQVMTLQNVDSLYVESNVNEADISEVRVGQKVNITFEAFGKGKIYPAELSLVDLAATTKDGVVNYKVRALLDGVEQVRPGMTADLEIITAAADTSPFVPTRYINEIGGEAVITVVQGEKKFLTEQRKVVLGIKGDGGIVQILSGVAIGDRVGIVSEE